MPSPPLSIIQSLSPRVAVLASDDVNDSCNANGCKGLEELLRPWEGGTERVSILSSTLQPTVHPSFPLRFVSYPSVYQQLSSPNPDIIVDLIGSCVGKHSPALLLSSRPLAPHETFNHPVGVMIAISTTTPDPMGTLTSLYGQAVGTGAQAAPWMDGVQVLKFFVVVHDVAKAGPSLVKAEELLANVKKAYGPHSTLLVINSRQQAGDVSTDVTTAEGPDSQGDAGALSQIYANALSSLTLSPMGAAAQMAEDGPPKTYASLLTSEDIQRLMALVRELVVQSLVPWMEARIREWNEAYQSSRRGLTGRLFGAGRKLFSSRPSSPSTTTGPAGYNAIKGYYPVNSPDGLSRRLADFAFMLRDYRYAAGVYDSLRRDYVQDKAWRYAAAANEMVGLSQLLSNAFFLPNTPPGSIVPFTTLQHTEISTCLENAVISYYQHGPPGHIQLDALRATVLYYEAWKAIQEWRGVGSALVKGAGEADEVPCAVLVEEAAAADVKGGKSKRGSRRQSLHLVMAAKKYEKAGYKAFSRRCLEQAASLMRGAPWKAALDNLEYALGRQAYTLGESAVAVEHFLRLLKREDTSSPGQSMVLEDMALAYEHLQHHPDQLEAAKGKLKLPTPIFDISKTKILLPEASSEHSTEGWELLEKRALANWDRKGKKPLSILPDPRKIAACVGETLYVELIASNPLNAPIVLENLTVGIEPAAAVEVQTIDEVALAPYETGAIRLAITPKAEGPFTVANATFTFHRFLPCVESLERKGKRLFATKQQRLKPMYAKDTSLTVHAEATRPRLEIELTGVPGSMFEGELVDAEITLRNKGTLGVENVELITNHYGAIVSPGKSVTVPVVFTAVAPGALDVKALAIFSAAGTDVLGCSRVSHAAEVRRALAINTEVAPARKGYFLAVTVTNHADVPLEVTGLSAVSEYWHLTSPADVSSEPLLPQQTQRLVLSVQAGGANVDLTQARLVSNLSHVLAGRPEAIESIEPVSVKLQVPTAEYLRARRAWRLRFATEHFPTLPRELVPRVLPLLDPLELDLVASWAAENRYGFACAHGIRPAPAFSLVESLRGGESTAKRTMYEETGRQMRALNEAVLEGVFADEADPLLVRTRVPSAKQGRVTHDFTKGGPVYTGTLSHRGTIPAGGRASVKTHAWVCEPGRVPLGGWEVIRETGDAETDGEWVPRMSWIGAGGGSVEVAAA
ncbi:hypothetical protein A1Q2_02222 [Trichosporon asahii var. asahii CBS 8904]|uniref:Uncharacterized protein n=1 Tax=Trichosporon asahii var. asahii (strain CBS 8904) TaxID=1220162 RepID=K1WR37_TRIAC|nr:hypothetical protein A1Q2_02222 [Trichosporon asahii var. asahii CBS 8904]